MSSPVLEAQPTAQPVPATRDDSLGIDRAFVLQMARMPALAVLWVAAAFASHVVWAALWPDGLNAGPLVVVGEGDVKMQMGFGAWVGAYFGSTNPTGLHGLGVVFWAFCFGAIVGGAFGMVIILARRKFGQNAGIVREIFNDLQLFGTGQVSAATKQAQERRSRWVKLPYGIPLCVGFIMYLLYVLVLRA